MFILDLMRQKREKLMRLKKDEMINEAARKQRERMQKVGGGICERSPPPPSCGTFLVFCAGSRGPLRLRRDRLQRGAADPGRGREEQDAATVEEKGQSELTLKKDIYIPTVALDFSPETQKVNIFVRKAELEKRKFALAKF